MEGHDILGLRSYERLIFQDKAIIKELYNYLYSDFIDFLDKHYQRNMAVGLNRSGYFEFRDLEGDFEAEVKAQRALADSRLYALSDGYGLREEELRDKQDWSRMPIYLKDKSLKEVLIDRGELVIPDGGENGTAANRNGEAETIPFSEKDTPAWRYFAPLNDDVEYRESIFVGYRYYETFHVPVKYPFGYGLSYTSFSYSELNVPEVYSGGKIQIRFKIKNIGKVSGAEIAQLYICPIESDVIRSHIELKGFQKIYLHPGEEKEVILELDERSFSVYDVEKKAFSMLSGKYQICIGASVHDLQLKANMEVVGNSYFRNERELFPDYFREQPHGMEISAEQFYQLLGGEPKHDKEKKRGEYTVYDSYQDVVNVSMFGKFVRGVVHIGLKIILRGKSERDPAFKMVKMGVEEGNLEGLIATSGGIATPKLIDMLVYNANKKYLQAFKRLLKK